MEPTKEVAFIYYKFFLIFKILLPKWLLENKIIVWHPNAEFEKVLFWNRNKFLAFEYQTWKGTMLYFKRIVWLHFLLLGTLQIAYHLNKMDQDFPKIVGTWL